MKIKFHFQYFIVFVVLLLVEIFIGVFVKDRFIRPFVGDVLSVGVLFAMFRTFYRGKGSVLAVGVLLFAFAVEFSQYFKLASYLGLEKGSVGYILLGATFDWLDLLAYFLGSGLNLFFDRRISNK